MCKMKEYCYAGDFAGVLLTFSFRHPDSAAYFNEWLYPEDPCIRFCSSSSDCMDIVRVPKSDCDCWIQDFGMGDNVIPNSE